MARSGKKSPAPPPAYAPAYAPPPAYEAVPTSAVVFKTKNNKNKSVKVKDDYSSDGVQDNDPFLLPGSDFTLLTITTIVSAIVRLFRIYQPSSVVFDEVQYVANPWKDIVASIGRILIKCLQQLRRLRIQVHQGQVLHGRPPAPRQAHDYPLRLARWV